MHCKQGISRSKTCAVLFLWIEGKHLHEVCNEVAMTAHDGKCNPAAWARDMLQTFELQRYGIKGSTFPWLENKAKIARCKRAFLCSDKTRCLSSREQMAKLRANAKTKQRVAKFRDKEKKMFWMQTETRMYCKSDYICRKYVSVKFIAKSLTMIDCANAICREIRNKKPQCECDSYPDPHLSPEDSNATNYSNWLFIDKEKTKAQT